MLRAGLIGFPSSGRTTLFQLLTAVREAPRAGHHGRVEPHVGVARVPDERLDRLNGIFHRPRTVSATVEFADTVGRGDAQVLIDLPAFREADALLHVVRLFRDAAVPPHAGTIDPARDMRALEDELILADLGLVERRLERVARDLKKGARADLQREQQWLARCKAALEEATPIRALAFTPDEARLLRGFQLLSAKPLLLVLNLDEADLPHVARIAELAGLTQFLAGARAKAVPVCAKIELEIAQLDPAEAAGFMADLGLPEPGVNRVIRAAYDLLGYISFFTIGDEECRAWSVPRGTPALLAAGEIHTDIARGFIRAEVVRYEHLDARGSLAACRDHGEVRLEGKDYIVQDGDVIHFRFAA